MKTKVRIAVAVDPTGDWLAYGHRKADDQEVMAVATDGLESGEARYWLEAELEVPETCAVTPTVTPA